MATPEEPTAPPVPEAVPPEVVQPTQPTTEDEELKAFLTELQKQMGLGFTAATIRKATVVSYESTASPPTCTVQFPAADGGAGESIPGVRHYDHYTPVAGDIVHVLKQGTDITAIGEINGVAQGGAPQGWATAASSVEYRKVVDNGDFKVQFKGSWSGSGTTLFTLPTGFRPSVTRTILCGRNGDAASIKVQISTGGVVTLVSGTAIPNTNPTTPSATGSSGSDTTGASGDDTTGASGDDTTGASGGDTTGASGGDDTGSSSAANTGSGGGDTTGSGGTGSTGGSSSADTGNNSNTHTHSMQGHTHVVQLDHSHSHGGAVPNTSFSETDTSTGPSSSSTGGNSVVHDHSMAHTHAGPSHTHSQPTHTHSMGSHTHTQSSHTHTQPTHTHTQPTHTHTQPSHTHSQPSHTHASASHSHTLTLALPTTVFFDDTSFFL